ncbi:MAG TPA: DinB family protein [Pseudoxanthomonas sp.]|nr:DinB family protein [Pseudoxanthomonas sp.]
MVTREYVRMMAAYNRWMNDKLYAAAARLTSEQLAADRGAFFGSVLGTLNHLVVADLIWLNRFAALPSGAQVLAALREAPMPSALDEMLFADFARLRERRAWLDDVIESWSGALGDGDLDQVLEYANTRGQRFRKRLSGVVMHFFNHQTHHRGQVTTLLSQAGIDVGETDLRALIPDEVAQA